MMGTIRILGCLVMADILKPPPKAQILNIVQPKMGWTLPKLHYGRIHLVHLRSLKYFTDDSSINFHDKFFLHFLLNFSKKWRKNLSWKFMDESSIRYLRIHKWTRWIWPKHILRRRSKELSSRCSCGFYNCSYCLFSYSTGHKMKNTWEPHELVFQIVFAMPFHCLNFFM